MTNYPSSLDLAFAALADPTRRAIVMRLSEQPASVSELSKPFDMALPTVLQHVRVLEASGLVESRKVGRVRTCTLNVAVLTATEQWLSTQRTVWERRLDRMDAYVTELHAGETSNAKRKRRK